MSDKVNRRDFLRLAGLTGVGVAMVACGKATEAPAPTEAPKPTEKPVEEKPTEKPAEKPTEAPKPTDTPAPEPTEALPEAAPGIPGVAREDTFVFNFSQSGAALAVNANLGYMTSQEGNAALLEPLYFMNPHDGSTPLVPWLAAEQVCLQRGLHRGDDPA